MLLYLDCQMFEFRHLPVAGGLYDQDPEWLADVRLINQAIAAEEEAESKREKDKKSGTMGR